MNIKTLFVNAASVAKKTALPAVATSIVATAAMATAATTTGAAADTTFNDILSTINAWASGTLGRLFAISAFVIGMGIGLMRQSAMAVVLGLAFALILAYGPSTIESIFTFAL